MPNFDTPNDEHTGLCHDLDPQAGNQGWWARLVEQAGKLRGETADPTSPGPEHG